MSPSRSTSADDMLHDFIMIMRGGGPSGSSAGTSVAACELSLGSAESRQQLERRSMARSRSLAFLREALRCFYPSRRSAGLGKAISEATLRMTAASAALRKPTARCTLKFSF